MSLYNEQCKTILTRSIIDQLVVMCKWNHNP